MIESPFSIYVGGSKRDLSRSELIDHTMGLIARETGDENVLLKTRVEIGSILVQTKGQMRYGGWEMWLKHIGYHQKKAERCMALATALADEHGALDRMKLFSALNRAFPGQFPELGSFDAARISMATVFRAIRGGGVGATKQVGTEQIPVPQSTRVSTVVRESEQIQADDAASSAGWADFVDGPGATADVGGAGDAAGQAGFEYDDDGGDDNDEDGANEHVRDHPPRAEAAVPSAPAMAPPPHPLNRDRVCAAETVGMLSGVQMEFEGMYETAASLRDLADRVEAGELSDEQMRLVRELLSTTTRRGEVSGAASE